MPGARRAPGPPASANSSRAVPGVAADDHAARARRLRLAAGQPAGQRRGGAAHHRAVHPVRPGADRAAQPRGAELQPAAEPVGQLRRAPPGWRRRAGRQLGPVPLVRVGG